MIWIIYLVYLYISGKEGSVFLGVPKTDWTTSSKVCTLPSRDDIHEDTNASKLLEVNNVTLAWTSTRVDYSRWAAFWGCLDDVSKYSQRFHVSLDDCTVKCSKNPNHQFFAYKNDECFCFGEVENINVDASSCRQRCKNVNTSDIACKTGKSALLFRFSEATDTIISSKYIHKECISTTPENGTKYAEDCDTLRLFHCVDGIGQIKSENWYQYQKDCFKGNVLNSSISVPDSILRKGVLYWTPIFRRNMLQAGQFESGGCHEALALNRDRRIEVVNCTDKLAFLCSSSGKIHDKVPDKESGGLFPPIPLPFWGVIATGAAFIILTLIIFVIACKIKQMKTMIAERDSRFSGGRPDNFSPPSRSQSNKVRLRDTYMDAADSPLRRGGYNDVYDDVNKGFKIKS